MGLLILSRVCWPAAGESFVFQKVPLRFFYSWQVHFFFYGVLPNSSQRRPKINQFPGSFVVEGPGAIVSHGAQVQPVL